MREFLEGHKNILLADDDSDDRELFLEAATFVDPTINVTLKRDGEELMDHLNTNYPALDLVFLDLNMPRKNGKECLAEIKKIHRYAQTPVIVYTTSLNPIDIEETFKLGASFFLRKPNSFEELKEMLGIVLNGTLTKSENSKDRFILNRTLNLV